jgi:hypothetical protein
MLEIGVLYFVLTLISFSLLYRFRKNLRGADIKTASIGLIVFSLVTILINLITDRDLESTFAIVFSSSMGYIVSFLIAKIYYPKTTNN